MKIGEFKVDFNKLYISDSHGQSKVEPKVLEVLKVLADHHGEIVTRDQLINEVWGIGHGGDERLSRAISLLRKALKDKRGSNDYIRTISGKGYKLTASILDEASVTDYSTFKKTKRFRPKLVTESHLAFDSKGHHTTKTSRKFTIFATLIAIILVLTASFLIAGPLNKTQKNYTVADGLEDIYNFTQPGAIEGAQEIFSTILAENPDHAAARAGLALALIRESTYLERDPALLKRAHSSAEAAYHIDNNLALANISVAWASEFRGEFEKALKYYDRADILDPDNPLTLEGRARTYYKQGLYGESRDVADYGHDKYPDYLPFYTLSGLLDIRENNFKSAEATFRELIGLSNGTNSRAFAQLAQSLHLQDRPQDAIKALQDGLELHQNSRLYNNLGTYLYFQGQYDMAADAFEKTLEFEGDTHDYLHWANLADAYRYVPGKSDQAYEAYGSAINLLTKIINTRPDDVTLITRLALYNVKSGKLDIARNILDTLPSDSYVSASDYFRLCLIYELLFERDLAIDNLSKAISLGYPKTEVLNEPDLKNLRQDKRLQLLLSEQKGQTNE
ncbi:winged helix-turn-helix domain-containing protein [Hellea sp.]|nr:winged helix-turn-helix domain-containing protein [Hellea sp.]